MTSDNNAVVHYALEVPTPADFKAIADLKAAAFADKSATSDGGANYRKYYQNHPNKIQHCRIIRENNIVVGIVVGAIQLQFASDPGDFDFPAGFRHHLEPGEAYVEFVACHRDHTGKGIGSKLLAWADTFARENGATKLSLEVMKKNRAVGLYKRKGYVVVDGKYDPCSQCFIGCILCCASCGKYWSILYMEKSLNADSSGGENS